jgi:hypothetical protein
MIGFRSTDTTYFVFHNDSSGTMVADNTGVSRTAAVTSFEIAFSATNVVCKINDTVVATLTTEIPTTTTILALHDYVVTSSTTAKLILIYKAYFNHKRTTTPF